MKADSNLIRIKAQNTFPDNFSENIPFINIPNEWKVKFIYPFNCAYSRFRLLSPNNNEYSVYLDIDGSLGCMDEPYWEVYPIGEHETERFALNDVEELIECIVNEDEK